MVSDAELLRAWRAGDRGAGSTLFSRHFEAVYRFFRNKLDGDIEDLVQRTFVACVEGRERFREESSFRTYLFGIAHHVLLDQLRRKYRASAALDLDVNSAVDLGASPLSILVDQREQTVLLQALRRIPLTSQVILELYFWERVTGAELGTLLGVVEDTARSRLRKAKQQLAAMIRRVEADPALQASTLSGLEQWAAQIRVQLAAPAGRT